MIERYNSPEISDIWNDQSKFKFYLEVELALLEALEEKAIIPKGVSSTIKEKATIKPERIKEIEAQTKHDVIAFCTSITENFSNDISKFFHFGCTSSDIIDTATNLQIKKSLSLILPLYEGLLEELKAKATEYKYTPCMGRSHGMNAEPMSFGQKFLSAYAEFKRHYQDLKSYYDNEITGQVSGAVGNYTVLDTEIEKNVMEKLGLKVEEISTQVIPRDRIAKLISINALVASAIERLSIEIRHLHHSDIGELFEGFSKGQKGSSTMPHKKNPISGENLSGLARVLRSHLTIAHENILLWHERDISHSSAERLMLPDNLGLMFYALKRLKKTIKNLVINTDHMGSKLQKSYTYLSSYILHSILPQVAMKREEVYAIVQKAAFESNDPQEFVEMVQKDIPDGPDFNSIKALDPESLKKIYLKEVDQVFSRVLD